MLFSTKKQKQNKIQDNIRWGRSLLTTAIIIISVMAASLGVTQYISKMEEERCFELLYNEAGNLADNIETYSQNDQEELEMLSAVISRYQDLSSPELWDILDSYTNVGMMSRIELLLPENIVLTKGGKRIDANGMLSFEAESEKGIHITDRETDIVDQDSYVIRHYVPVKQNDVTIAMLYGVIVPNELPKDVNLNPYNGEGALYLIDGKTGDFLVDTWHPGVTGNMWELGEREMAPGYDSTQLKEGVYNGESNYVVFVSKTVGEYLYFYYEPMAINDWRIAVSVPESVVFKSANNIKRVLNVFIGFELICFIIYFLWMMRYVHNVTSEKQKQLDMVSYIYNVEQLLFNAHEKKENLYAALIMLGEIISVEKISFWIFGENGENQWYFWDFDKPIKERKESNYQGYIWKLLDYFEDGNEIFECHDNDKIKNLFLTEKLSNIYNIIAVPVKGVGGHILGILAACNVKKKHEQAVLLKSIQFSFGMFCSNLKSYTAIQEQGNRDALTGLYNRNRYEQDLPEIYGQHKSFLACVYIDVNGLHEMNNTMGHDKGDKMLRTVASGIKKYFDTEYIYRTGGDEFVLFIPDVDEEDLKIQSEKLATELSNANYYISVGIGCGKNLSSLSLLIKEAEQKMYVEKKKYYEKHDRRRNPRN